MNPLLTGLHHVTALAGDPVENHDFYTRVLGQRLVKRTVNFDDPLTYHLYFGDGLGTPGTLLTHFPHPQVKRGVHGSPEILVTELGAPRGALPYWSSRLRAHGVTVNEETRDGRERLAFEDPHGMRLAVVEHDDAGTSTGDAGHDVDPRSAITGIDGVVIHVPDPDETTSFLTDVLGFTTSPLDGRRRRIHLGEDRSGRRLELVASPHDPRTTMGAGTVHHVAWRVPDDETQLEVAHRIRAAGIAVTPVMDRQYFRSIYARIPGGVIFEVATDAPGFAVDESPDALGTALKLPPRLEPRRAEIEAHLVPLPASGAPGAEIRSDDTR